MEQIKAMHELVYSVREINRAVDLLYSLMARCRIFTFEGALGAGKTTLVKALLKKCGVEQTVTSPTFTYVNVYKNNQNQTFYHFDLYRITSLDEFIEQGFNEFLYVPNNWVFIEWPQVIEPLLRHNIGMVQLDYIEHNKRLMRVTIR